MKVRTLDNLCFRRRPRVGEIRVLRSAAALASRRPDVLGLIPWEGRWLLVVSRHGLREAAVNDLHREVVSAFGRELMGVLPGPDYLRFRRRFEIVDPRPHPRFLTARPGEGTRLEPLVSLTRGEGARLDAHLAGGGMEDVLAAPVGRSGETLRVLLGMPAGDAADAFAYLLKEAPRRRVPLVILWTEAPLLTTLSGTFPAAPLLA
jgi:hypothetical protein